MRSFPRTPVAQALTVVGIVACLVMILASPVAGLVILAGALLLAVALRLTGLR